MAADRVFVDTNVLLTACDPARALHSRARALFQILPDRGVALYASGQIMREYLVVATRPREVNGLGLSVPDALGNLALFRQRLTILDEDAQVAATLLCLVEQTGSAGKAVHDTNVAATAIRHGVGALLTADGSHFDRFTEQLEIAALGDLVLR